MRRLSVPRRVTLFITVGFGLIWAVAVLLMASVLWSEQQELFDQELAETTHVLLPLISQQQLRGGGPDIDWLRLPPPGVEMDEALVYRLVDREGNVLQQSALAEAAGLPPPSEIRARLTEAADYRIYSTLFNAAGHALQLAAPMAEQREAFEEGMTGFLLPMIALLPLTWLMTGWIARRALAPLSELGAEIAARDGNRLDAIDASDWPDDLVQIAGTLNGFMARLTQALDAERAFATNAAHELRTPVAIALAQVQQLRDTTTDTGQIARIGALERALQRMRRLVARLLQLARADAGIGLSEASHDLVPLVRAVLADSVPHRAAGRIVTDLPDREVQARIDPDAFAIILGNLIDNALQHGSESGRVQIAIRPGPVLDVTNDGPVVPGLEDLPRRFARRGRDGFGLGLHICRQIAEQAGGRLDLMSPVPGQTGGFLVRVTLPRAEAS